ncbi:MAG: formyl transferase [Bacteroidota bacterium]
MVDQPRTARKTSDSPLKLVLLCGDGPQQMYLRYRLTQEFPGYRCILEPDAGQRRHLLRKGKRYDYWYMRYHSWRRKWTGSSRKRRDYFARLLPAGYQPTPPDLTVDTLNDKAVRAALDEWRPEVTIVSGTKYIGRSVIRRAGTMINLHTGFLPDYKGNQCIFFALYHGEPDKVAATLHELSAELDGGQILDLVRPELAPGLGEDALYTRCAHAAVDRIVELLAEYARGEAWKFTPQAPTGKMFRHRDRTPWKEIRLWWRMRGQN